MEFDELEFIRSNTFLVSGQFRESSKAMFMLSVRKNFDNSFADNLLPVT